MAAFRIWYGDGTTVDGEGPADWLAAPADDVQFIYCGSFIDAEGSRIWKGCGGSDWYWMDSKGAIGSGASHPVRGKMVKYDGPIGAVVKTGKWCPEIETIMQDFMAWVMSHG